MNLPANKTKIVATIGPASEARPVIEEMISAGMTVARLNLAHGSPAGHARTIKVLRAAAARLKRPLAIMADLPGPKMRIGPLAEPLELSAGDPFTLTTRPILGDRRRVSVSFARLPKVIRPGDTLFINDGLVQLEAVGVSGPDVRCRVVVGGEIRSHKGLNLPGIDLGISAFTKEDRRWLSFAAAQGIDAVSQSFVERGADLRAVRKAAAAQGYEPFVIAKIERAKALEKIDDILAEADGIMVARGDLGVEISIERIAIVQKELIHKANLLGKPVITATQMLQSLTVNRRPTRAEATDVANAVLDGADCLMLSEESAMGSHPVEAVAMLASIAAAAEPHRRADKVRGEIPRAEIASPVKIADLIAMSVETALERIVPAAVFVPTRSGATARSLARFRPPVWIVAVSSQKATCQQLLFSAGIHPLLVKRHPKDWNSFIKGCLEKLGLTGNLVILTEGPSEKYPRANNRMEIIRLTDGG